MNDTKKTDTEDRTDDAPLAPEADRALDDEALASVNGGVSNFKINEIKNPFE